MDYIPFNYQQINISDGTFIPSDKFINSKSYAYWMRSLFQRAMFTLVFDGLPFKGSEKDFFLYTIFKYGYSSLFYDDEYGLLSQPCTIGGINVNYQPTYTLVNNPTLINSKKLDINYGDRDYEKNDCALIKLSPDFIGVYDIIRYYASKLSSLDSAIDVSIDNSKVPYIAYGKNKASIQTLKKIVDKIQSGVSAIFTDTSLSDEDDKSPIEFLDRPNFKGSYITDDLLRDQQTLLRSFDKEIGIPTIPYEKRERLVEDEANSAIIDSQARITIWQECLQESFSIANKLFNLNMSVKLRYDNEVI